MKTYTYRGFVIKPKRDFGSNGYLVDGKCVKKGWVVCYGQKQKYAGCNAMPGACWFGSLSEARHGIDVLIKVGGEKNSERFWEIMQPFEYTRVGQKADFENGTVTKGRFVAVIENFRVVKLRKDRKLRYY